MRDPHRGAQLAHPPPKQRGRLTVSATSGAGGRCARGVRLPRLPPDSCSKSWPARHARPRFERSGEHNRGERGVQRGGGWGGGGGGGIASPRMGGGWLCRGAEGGPQRSPRPRAADRERFFFLVGFQMTDKFERGRRRGPHQHALDLSPRGQAATRRPRGARELQENKANFVLVTVSCQTCRPAAVAVGASFVPDAAPAPRGRQPGVPEKLQLRSMPALFYL